MKILVIGCGSIGRRHIGNLVKLGVDVLACDNNAQKLEGVLAAFPGLRGSTELKELLSERPDAAVVAVPTALHVPTALRAARAGCHLFIEKPLSHNSNGLQSLRSLVRRKRLIVYMGYNFRFHPSLVRLKKGLDDQFIGRVFSGRTHFGSYLPERHPGQDYRKGYGAKRSLGGGVMLDSLSHHIDYLGHLLGGPPQAVFCDASKKSLLEIDVEDVVEALLRFKNGALVSVHGNWIQRPYKHTVELIGDGGTAVADIFAVTLKHYQLPTQRWKVYGDNRDLNRMYYNQMKDFLACVRRGSDPRVDLDKAIEQVRVLEALRRSSATKRWVNL